MLHPRTYSSRRSTKPGRHLQAFIIRAYGAAVTEATAGGVRGIDNSRTNLRNRRGGGGGVVGWTNPGVFSTPRLIPSLSAICNCFVSAEDRGGERRPKNHRNTTAGLGTAIIFGHGFGDCQFSTETCS